MTVTGDRQSASLLSALAEAPDSAAASAFLVAQIAELSGAERVAMLRIDAPQEALVSVAATDGALSAPTVAIPIADLGNPLTVAALCLCPVTGDRPMTGAFSNYRSWTALPMTQPRTRIAPQLMSRQQAVELLAPQGLAPVARAERV